MTLELLNNHQKLFLIPPNEQLLHYNTYANQFYLQARP